MIYKDNNIINVSITEPRATVNIINGNPILNHWIKLILCPYFREIPIATTPALDPIQVPFPPRPAPNAKGHQRGLVFKFPKRGLLIVLEFNISIIGTIVVVKGIFSINPLVIADIQITE